MPVDIVNSIQLERHGRSEEASSRLAKLFWSSRLLLHLQRLLPPLLQVFSVVSIERDSFVSFLSSPSIDLIGRPTSKSRRMPYSSFMSSVASIVGNLGLEVGPGYRSWAMLWRCWRGRKILAIRGKKFVRFVSFFTRPGIFLRFPLVPSIGTEKDKI